MLKHIKYFSEYETDIVESLKTGRQLVSKYSIDSSTFDSLIDIDPTSSKKYLDSIIKFYARDKVGLDVLGEYISIWDELLSKNIIPSNKRDINKIKSFQEFSDLIHQYQTIKTSSEQKRDAHRMEREWANQNVDVVYDENGWFVVRPLDHKASVWFGRNSHWCTALRKSKTYWNQYAKWNAAIYYCLDKTKPTYNYNDGLSIGDPSSLIAVAVHPTWIGVYDGGDIELDFDEWIKSVPIPKNIFKGIVKLNTDKSNNKIYVGDVNQLYYLNQLIDSNVDIIDGDVNLHLTKDDKLPNMSSIKKITKRFKLTNNSKTPNFTIQDFPKEVYNIYLNDCGIHKVIGLENLICTTFDISNNELITLDGCPKKVDGWFNAYNNKLITLKDGPEEVEHDFNVSNNSLTSLDGCPKIIGNTLSARNNKLNVLNAEHIESVGNFDVSRNNLTSLIGSPKYVRMSYNASFNKLTDLSGCPNEIYGNFNVSHNNLKTLKNGPISCGGDFDASSNKLNSLKGSPKNVEGDFDVEDNRLTTLKFGPDQVGTYNYKNNYLEDDAIKNISTYTKILFIS